MKKLYLYIKKNIFEVIFIVIIDTLISIINYFFLHISDLKLSNFDLQTFLTWYYAASRNLIPYKDLYYPYGLLSYYRQENIYFSLIYIFISVLAFNVTFYIFKIVFKQNFLSYAVSIIFLVFILLIPGLETFNRYGVSFALTLIISYVFFVTKTSKKILFALGFIISTIFWMLHDQGIYAYIIFAVFFFSKEINKFMLYKNKLRFFGEFFKNTFSFLFGCFIGLFIFLIYLIKHNAVSEFWYYLTVSLPEFPVLSKTPFFNFLFTFNNLFSIAVLCLSIFFVIYKLLKKRKKSLFMYIEIGLIILILLFEQKNVIRSISISFTFVSFALLFIVLFDFIILNKKNIRGLKPLKLTYLLILLFITIVFYFSNYNFNTFFTNKNNSSTYNSHIAVINKLRTYSQFNNKIFSFPGDPIFYTLLKQIPPYFTSIYEASSEQSQQRIIDYMKNNNIWYVVINIGNKSIQDTVPNYIRGVYELKYILNNYSVKDTVSNFLILERNSNKDFFTKSNDYKVQEYINYLLNVNLESIPYSEGIYKSRSLINNIIIINASNSRLLNEFLNKNVVNSKNIVLVVKNNINSAKSIQISVKSENDLSTNVNFKSCDLKFCYINLSNLPLFYKNRRIKSINYNDNSLVGLIKVNDNSIKELW